MGVLKLNAGEKNEGIFKGLFWLWLFSHQDALNAIQEGTVLEPVQVFLKTSPRFLQCYFMLLQFTHKHETAFWQLHKSQDLVTYEMNCQTLLNIAFKDYRCLMLKTSFPLIQSSLYFNMTFDILPRHVIIRIRLLGGFLGFLSSKFLELPVLQAWISLSLQVYVLKTRV